MPTYTSSCTSNCAAPPAAPQTADLRLQLHLRLHTPTWDNASGNDAYLRGEFVLLPGQLGVHLDLEQRLRPVEDRLRKRRRIFAQSRPVHLDHVRVEDEPGAGVQRLYESPPQRGGVEIALGGCGFVLEWGPARRVGPSEGGALGGSWVGLGSSKSGPRRSWAEFVIERNGVEVRPSEVVFVSNPFLQCLLEKLLGSLVQDYMMFVVQEYRMCESPTRRGHTLSQQSFLRLRPQSQQLTAASSDTSPCSLNNNRMSSVDW